MVAWIPIIGIGFLVLVCALISVPIGIAVATILLFAFIDDENELIKKQIEKSLKEKK